MRQQRLTDLYTIERRIGKGGMGTVLAAKEIATGRPVAIKLLGAPGLPAPDERDLARFEQEARIASSLASPHVMRVLDIACEPEARIPYAIMERLEGEDLQELLDRVGALPEDVAVRVAMQACAGLAAAHAAGVVHRDIKPSNLFLTRQGDGDVIVKVVDFGVAKIRRLAAGAFGASGALPAPASSMTKSGDLLGSPLFMSPEQVEASRHVDARADVFSMGVVLHAMLTGSAPFSHIQSFVHLLYSIVNDEAPPLATRAPWASAALANVVDRAMAHDVEARFPDATAMLVALHACAPDTALRGEMLVAEQRAPPAPRADPHAQTHHAPEERPPESFWQRLWRGGDR